ncbi:hypothetical protein [Streptococcus moroccensis]|uniref:Uncharacterized protein n=1 Tax=Streptococcus moroccensis TaxID=1451356 RepID=A0ABT9YP48_9STRE|nr:hypothetical protein [Streptococcus moroccensis]MDQ0221657.1 hypothetical protein [Streptococcus moroccensis]
MFIDGMLHPFLQALIVFWILKKVWDFSKHPFFTMLTRMRWKIIQELYEEDKKERERDDM